MLTPLSWLGEYVSLPPLPKLIDRLNQTGTTVAAVHQYGEGLDKIIVGQILEVTPHPNADKLQLAKVQIPGKVLSIVCGAKNIEAGQKVPVAKVGTTVPVGKDGEPLKIERVKIREVESAGMLCSPKELGLGDDHSGILILDKDLKIGTPLTKALSLPETVLETEVTTNRGDELSIYGLAGEIAAITGNKHRPLITKESPVQITPAVKLTVSADPAFCRRYSAQVVTNLSLAPSPAFIQLRLRQAGMRPINNVVDITNYVMLLTGQPLHAFDYRKISGGEIIVRESRTGDRITTLDGVTRQLGFGQIVISDKEKILGLGGVMGGEDSGVTNLTDTVVIESAVFDPMAIRQTTVKYNLRSEASFRFERGVEIGGTLRALNLAVELLQKYAGGKAASPVIDVYPQKYVPAHVTMTSSKLNQYLGYDYPLSQAEKILTGLGLLAVSKTKDKLTVKVPSWRERDVTIEEDLIEEVARIEGYDNIPSLMPSGEVPKTPPITNINLIQDIRGHLSSLGLTEVSVYPMISPDLNLEENALKISNSISGQWEYLRTSLIPGLAETSAKNINLGEEGPIFEIGKVYLPSEGLPQEKEILALSAADFSLVKGYVQSVLEKLSLPSSKYKKGSSQLFTEDSTSFVEVNGTIAGQMGEITEAFAKKTGLHRSLYFAEIDLTTLLTLVPKEKTFKQPPKYPSIHEDISIIVSLDTPVGELTDAIMLYAKTEYLVEAKAFDIFADEKLGAGKKSVSLALTFQAVDKTLTDNEIRSDREKIERLLKENFKAKIR